MGAYVCLGTCSSKWSTIVDIFSVGKELTNIFQNIFEDINFVQVFEERLDL